ncbi:MAG TPA: zinc ribbon domain-containing protein, partial [Terrabacter sp.]|nr:zinc ribbon domain-containing protein [Terrabacter sp.]
MPTYSYACQNCGHAFDIRQSFSDDALTVCPECGEPRLRKVIHPVGI